ncbi:MAG: hypothetical protein H8D67_04400 [Deltaproteobacteria bacterium]|nr:hypothetical protein [Deltaproteobacteria bacterium]
MPENPTRTEIAADFALWGEYVDPDSHQTETEFDAMSVEEKITFQREIWPHDLDD